MDALRWGPAAGGAPRSLVLLLHGVGADGSDLIELARNWGRAAPDALFLAPDAPEPYDGAPMGRQWFSLADRRPVILAAAIRAAAPALARAVADALLREKVAPERLVLMGFSQGAMMALHAGLRLPTPPAGIMAFAGALLDPATLPAEATRPPPPVLLVHGAADDVVPPFASEAAAAALDALGAPTRLLSVPGLGHALDDAALNAGAAFLRDRVKPS